jgi:hypothetical protein
MYTVLLPPGVNPVAVTKYINKNEMSVTEPQLSGPSARSVVTVVNDIPWMTYRSGMASPLCFQHFEIETMKFFIYIYQKKPTTNNFHKNYNIISTK